MGHVSSAPYARCRSGSVPSACIAGRARLGARALRPDLAGDRQAGHLLRPRLLPRHLHARLRARMRPPCLRHPCLRQTCGKPDVTRRLPSYPQRLRPGMQALWTLATYVHNDRMALAQVHTWHTLPERREPPGVSRSCGN